MTTATDTFRQHLQETQAIHFLPYVGTATPTPARVSS